jgi:hypothetical protein
VIAVDRGIARALKDRKERDDRGKSETNARFGTLKRTRRRLFAYTRKVLEN